MSERASAVLAEIASTETLAAFSPPALERAAGLLAATLAGGRDAAPPAPLAAVLLALGAPPSCSLFYSDDRAGALYAAYLNAAALVDPGAAFDGGLAAAVVVPACAAAAELEGRSGGDLLLGVAVGLEVALRLAAALGSRHEERGFTLLGSAGRIAAALGAATTLGLPRGALLATLGFSATQAAGPLRGAEEEARALLGAKAAADGLEAALLCAAGLIGPAAPLEGRRGLFALELAGDPAALEEALGSRWLLGELPAPSVSAPLLAACRALTGAGTFAEAFAVARA